MPRLDVETVSVPRAGPCLLDARDKDNRVVELVELDDAGKSVRARAPTKTTQLMSAQAVIQSDDDSTNQLTNDRTARNTAAVAITHWRAGAFAPRAALGVETSRLQAVTHRLVGLPMLSCPRRAWPCTGHRCPASGPPWPPPRCDGAR